MNSGHESPRARDRSMVVVATALGPVWRKNFIVTTSESSFVCIQKKANKGECSSAEGNDTTNSDHSS